MSLELCIDYLQYHQEGLFVAFHGWYDDAAMVYVAMEHFPLGDLEHFVHDDISENCTREIISQLLQGLHIIHGEGFTHRDLKPAVSLPVSPSRTVFL